jgi:hypothetical protein
MTSPRVHSLDRRSLLLGGIAAGSGLFAASRFLGGPSSTRATFAQDVSPDATATRQAELDELSAMRTALAASPDCDPIEGSPVPQPTPTQTPPVPQGTEAELADPLYFTLLTIDQIGAPTDFAVSGTVVQVAFAVRNSSTEAKKMKFSTFLLSATGGASALFTLELNNELYGSDIALAVPGLSTKQLAMAFDFPDAAVKDFILENSAYPDFRAAGTMIERG